jgi:hypothetical protein
MKENFKLVRVVTRDIVTDLFQGFRNLFGLRLRGYETMLNRNIKEMLEEMELRYKVKWYRMIINPLNNNSAMIIIYGNGEKNE